MLSRQTAHINESHRAALRAYILDDDRWELRYAPRLEKDGNYVGYSLLIWFTLEAALRRHFSSTCSLADVIRYVADLRMILAEHASLLNPSLAEKIIRSLLGDISLPEGFSQTEAPEEMLSIALLLLRSLVNEAHLDEVSVDQLLNETVANAERLTEEATADARERLAARRAEASGSSSAFS